MIPVLSEALSFYRQTVDDILGLIYSFIFFLPIVCLDMKPHSPGDATVTFSKSKKTIVFVPKLVRNHYGDQNLVKFFHKTSKNQLFL